MRIALVGNYRPDAQESMLRYAQMMLRGLSEAQQDVTLASPNPVLNWPRRDNSGIWKWVGYVDKYWAGTGDIRRVAQDADVVHVCDHANSVYIPRNPQHPYVVTCHDLLAVRGALGEDTDCPASGLGRYLQLAILRGLRRAHVVACVSRATLTDAQRLLGPDFAGQLRLVPNGLNYPYRRLDEEESRRRLAAVRGLTGHSPFILHVGNDQLRKNRAGVLRAFARICPQWPGKLVLAGQSMQGEMRSLAADLGLLERIVEVSRPDNELLEALYSSALVFVFPSRFEGFGWPVIEAQACGCPVICSDRPPLPEVAGNGALLCAPDDAGTMGTAILGLVRDPVRRAELARLGIENAARYGAKPMIETFLDTYTTAIRLAGRLCHA
jgi:glycosyltransferase involved in cell wall biosynthesis